MSNREFTFEAYDLYHLLRGTSTHYIILDATEQLPCALKLYREFLPLLDTIARHRDVCFLLPGASAANVFLLHTMALKLQCLPTILVLDALETRPSDVDPTRCWRVNLRNAGERMQFLRSISYGRVESQPNSAAIFETHQPTQLPFQFFPPIRCVARMPEAIKKNPVRRYKESEDPFAFYFFVAMFCSRL